MSISDLPAVNGDYEPASGGRPGVSIDPYQREARAFPDESEFVELSLVALEWASVLGKELDERADDVRKCRGYYDGDHPLRHATRKWRQTFGSDFGEITDNWCRIAVDAATERMALQGFINRETGKIDEAAFALFRDCALDVDIDVAHTDALVTAQSYILVSEGENGKALVTVEDPLQSAVALNPANRRERLAGFKRWRETDKTWAAIVTTPTWTAHLARTQDDSSTTWKVREIENNPLGVVPLIPLINNPDVYSRGRSDLAPMIPLQDGINKLLSDMLIASEFAAFPQRVLMGVEVPMRKNPATGEDEPAHDLVGGINRWLAIEDEKAKVQELKAADLSNYTKTIDQLTQHAAAATRTPVHYLLGQMVNVSGDTLAAAESGLVFRVRRKLRLFGQPWCEAISLARKIESGGPIVPLDPIWANPERVSDSQRADAASKLKLLNIPEEALWRLGTDASPSEIKDWRRMREEEAVLDGIRMGISGASGLPPEVYADIPAGTT